MSHRETDTRKGVAPPPPPPAHPPAGSSPRPVVLLFGAFFAGLAAWNLSKGGTDFLTIFLSSAALLCLGVDVSKVMGRK